MSTTFEITFNAYIMPELVDALGGLRSYATGQLRATCRNMRDMIKPAAFARYQLRAAAQRGDRSAVIALIGDMRDACAFAIYHAARYDHRELCEELTILMKSCANKCKIKLFRCVDIDRDHPSGYDCVLCGAARGGQLDLFSAAVKHRELACGALNRSMCDGWFNKAMYKAACGAHMNIIKRSIELIKSVHFFMQYYHISAGETRRHHSGIEAMAREYACSISEYERGIEITCTLRDAILSKDDAKICDAIDSIAKIGDTSAWLTTICEIKHIVDIQTFDRIISKKPKNVFIDWRFLYRTGNSRDISDELIARFEELARTQQR